MSPALVSMSGSPVGNRASFTVTEALNAALSGPQQGMAPLACGFTAFRAASAEQGATHVRPTWRSGCRLAGAANFRRPVAARACDSHADPLVRAEHPYLAASVLTRLQPDIRP
jgi:hypothetical protein